MFFNDVIQRRVAAVLRPWLRDDPELEIKLGLLRSNGTLNNVKLNTFSLNELLEDPSRCCFKEVRVEQLSIKLSPWSSSAFTLVIRGLHLIISIGEEADERGVKWRPRIKDITMENKSKVLAEIDPEGCTLHASLRRITNITTRTWRKSLLNTLFAHSQIQFHDVHVLFQSGNSNNAFSFSLYVKKVEAGSQNFRHRCFVSGFMGSLFVPSEESSFDVDIDSFEIRLNGENHSSSLIPATNMSALVNVANLQFTSICICIPKLQIIFSPADLSIMLLFYALLSKESKCTRPGRLLWNIVDSRLSSLVPSTNLSILKVVKFTCLWLRYLNTYENLLRLIGYPATDQMKRAAEVMSRDTTYSRSVKSKWKLISKIENDLPLRAIAFARQITRFRLASRGPKKPDGFDEPLGKGTFWKLPQLFLLILWAVGSLLRSISRFLLLYKVLTKSPKIRQNYTGFHEDCVLGNGISIIVQQISLSVFPNNSAESSTPGKAVAVTAVSYQDLLSFHILADAFFLRYVVNVSDQYMMSAVGCLKILSSTLVNVSASSKTKEPANKKFDEKQIVWGEPCQIINLPEATDASGETSVPRLDHIIGSMWLNWKESYPKFEEVNSNVLTPWILFELKSSLTRNSLDDDSSWFYNCGLTVGRLNFYLDFYSIATIIVLLRQIQCSLSLNDKTRENVILRTLDQDPSVNDLSSRFKSYSRKIESDIVRMLPQKHIQIGLLIAGLHIQMSLLNNKFYGENVGDHQVTHVTFDILNIELVVSPKLENDLGLPSESVAGCDRASEHHILEPQEIDASKSENEAYNCQENISVGACLKVYGLKAYLVESAESHKYQLVLLSPMTTRLQYTRNVHHSYDSKHVALSATCCCVAAGFTMLVFLDEWHNLTKVFSGVFYKSLAFAMYGSGVGPSHQEIPSRESVYSDSESGDTVLKIGSHESLVTSTHFVVRSTCELKAFNLVLHNSRESFNLENYMNVMPIDRETGRISATHDTSGLGIYISLQQLMTEFNIKGGDMDFIIDVTGIRSIIFRYLAESERRIDKFELKNLLRCLNFIAEGAITKIRMCLCLRSCKYFQSIGINSADNLSCSHGKTTRHMLGDLPLKGGSVLLEATAAALFVACYTAYCNCILELWSAGQSLEQVVVSHQVKDTTAQDSHFGIKPQQVNLLETMQDCLELFSLFLSHLSLILVARDENGRLQELLIEVDFNLNLKMLNMARTFSMGIPKFSMVSRIIYGGREHKGKVTQSSLYSPIEDSSSLLGNEEAILSGHTDASGSSLRSSEKAFNIESSISRQQHKNLRWSQNSIVEDLKCFLAVEGPVTKDQTNHAFLNDFWVGNGSISGLDMTITLLEIKMILSAYESISKVSNRKKTFKVESDKQLNRQEPEGCAEEFIPDGTIVAIQDTEQHMYIAVEGSENKYDIDGTIHYSLVGKRALFRVKYHNQRHWKSKAQYFSLQSLYAKDDSGKSLQLSSNPRSRFVDISCSSDSDAALWRMLSFKDDTYEDAVELEFPSHLAKRTFHLLNKKNDYAVAFIDGVLEFVSKPGNLFKWKLFSDPGPGNNMLPDISLDSSEISNQSDSNIIESGESRINGNHLGITITVDKVTLTIVHELLNTEEKFPLLQGSFAPNQAIIQISKSKLRVMNTSVIVLCFFDAQRNSWVDFVQQFEFNSFYRSKFHIQGSENMHGVRSHFYAKIKEVNLSVSELSLDILLFVIGELDVAGPYAIKKPVVSTNYGKVVNQSGMTLLCQFYDNENVLISARQSDTVFLRHLALANLPPEASLFSLQLRDEGFLSTSPIHLSLLETRKFAWRTRIISSQDSKSFPGPLIVVEISRGIEGGISITVSPMLNIHNETDFPLELRFQRPQQKETDAATLTLKAGDDIDDSLTAFNAVDSSGGLRKALTSLSVGNFVFSFRPNIDDGLKIMDQSRVEWSDDLKGGKPVHLSGVFDKLSYRVRKALSVNSVKSTLTSANCVLKSEEVEVNIHFLILTVGKGLPVVNPDNFGYAPGNRDSPVAMQEHKEIFVLPTIQVSNLLHTELHVSLSDKDLQTSMENRNPWSNATIPCGSTVNFYANPETIYFTVTLTSFNSRSKPVNSSDWVRKLQKLKSDIPHLDMELEFDGGKYFATLRLSRGHRGTLKVAILTKYAIQNNTDALLFCFVSKQKSFSSEDMKRSVSSISPELGSCLPSNSIASWFMKCTKLRLKLLEEKAFETQLDLDALSGLAEIDLEVEDISGLKSIMKLGVSLRPSTGEEALVTLSSRYVVCNESEEIITVQQCYMEGMEESITIKSKQRIALRLRKVMKNMRETNRIENLLRKHTRSQGDVSLFIQFRLNENGLSWSGPVCVASLGRFFLKFRKSSEYPDNHLSNENNLSQYAVVHVVEEGSSIVLHFQRQPDTNLPYRIENHLHDAPISFYQKGSSAPEALGAGVGVGYVWDDLTLPHKLVVQLDDVHLLREINLDKVRSWKPFYRNKQTRGLGFHIPLERKDKKRTTYNQQLRTETVKVGYEVYAEGVTRVLRICDFSNSHKVNEPYGTKTKMRLRISYLAVHLLESAKQEVDISEPSNDVPIIIGRFETINCDCLFTSRYNYNQIQIQSLSVDEKWIGAPFATMLRRHQSEKSDANDCILRVMIILLPSSSHVKQVKHLSIVLLPLTLNLDEETLMKIVPFWRSSLSDPSAPRQQYYFDHFEIHPIKIVASFLPGELYYSYSSTQDTLRSLLHSVIKMPAIQSKTVELNGVLVTHALITLRELTIKCAQHYSWYSLRAIYMAKGSPLLPPAFASIFDDLASSSLDVFFDPSSGLLNLPGVTLGTLKLISKFIDNKGFSGTRRYFGDLGKTLKTAGSNILFAAVTEVSDSVLKGAETSGFSGMVGGFHQGILKLAMEPTVLGNAFMEGGPDRKIKLVRSPGIDEASGLYIEGYLQAMLDTVYKQEYLRVKVTDNVVILKNLPPSSALINEIMGSVNDFLASKSLVKGETTAHSLRYMRGEREWRIGPTVLTLCEHLFVSFAIRFLRKQAGMFVSSLKLKDEKKEGEEKAIVESPSTGIKQKVKVVWKWGIAKFMLSGIVAYIDGRLCRNIPDPLARRIVSGFLLSFVDIGDGESR
ncbi:hypothetical protein F511_01958 [Dorcoceras hygrometricum]|uniref:Vacuolar protein sorting-associated protein 13 VPS13 adaptor binding domain-containing protein n=1 Tax=Dorcoceras hygrometricum TaxID=472368 RepID=A0A2Z7AUE1_9LAMI|nr:hypothetical protein F511_01958 [Dorcoceras hygrometricum]